MVVHGLSESLCAAQVPLGSLDGHVAEQKLNLLQLAACCVAETGARAAAVVRGQLLQPGRLGVLLHHVPLSVIPLPQMRPNRPVQRNKRPSVIRATVVHAATAVCTQSGTGTVRMCLPFPMRSTRTQ